MLNEIKKKFEIYNHLKASGMLSGKYGDKEAIRRMSEIRFLLKSSGYSMKDLKKDLDKAGS